VWGHEGTPLLYNEVFHLDTSVGGAGTGARPYLHFAGMFKRGGAAGGKVDFGRDDKRVAGTTRGGRSGDGGQDRVPGELGGDGGEQHLVE
jgi:hypothetical protein